MVRIRGRTRQRRHRTPRSAEWIFAQPDHYLVLGVGQGTAPQGLKKAYRERAMKYHPDHNQGREQFNLWFLRIHEAYETLKDPVKREEHNKELRRRALEMLGRWTGTWPPAPGR